MKRVKKNDADKCDKLSDSLQLKIHTDKYYYDQYKYDNDYYYDDDDDDDDYYHYYYYHYLSIYLFILLEFTFFLATLQKHTSSMMN